MSTHAPPVATGGRSATSAVIIAVVAAVLVTGVALAARGLTSASADSALQASAKARAALQAQAPAHAKPGARLMGWHAPKVPKAHAATYGAPSIRTIYVAQHTTATPAPQPAPAPSTTSARPSDDGSDGGGGSD